MKSAEAEKLLGGYATGTLTEEEGQRLFAAALEHQELFDALMDEEALRELLADPAVKAQLILALAHSAAPNVVPLWRRRGVLGTAAGLLVAATAGLVVLRSPDGLPMPEAAKPLMLTTEPPPQKVEAPAAKAAAPAAPSAPEAAKLKEAAPVQAQPIPAIKVAPPPPPAPQNAAPAAVADALQRRDQAEQLRAEAQGKAAKKAVASQPVAAAVVEVQAAPASTPEAKRPALERANLAGAASGAMLSPGVTTGSAHAKASTSTAPTWSLQTRPDGSTVVEVVAARTVQLVLLQRGPSGVVVLNLQPQKDLPGDRRIWRCAVRLLQDDTLDLYQLDQSVADPTQLPETGPVAGFRVRIHPASKKAPKP